MLFVTNGDSAAGRIRRLGLAAEVLPWRDVLHEGPVPSGLSPNELREVRAHFMAQKGWGDFVGVLDDFVCRDATLDGFRDYEEVVTWFEHDLYDQLQLIQLLDYFGRREMGRTRVALIRTDEYLGTLEPDRLRALFDRRHEVARAALDLGHRAWIAFASEDPAPIHEIIQENSPDLPFLAGALLRHLQQFPSVETGLSRSERQLLTTILGARASSARHSCHPRRKKSAFSLATRYSPPTSRA